MEKKKDIKGSIFDRSREQQSNDSSSSHDFEIRNSGNSRMNRDEHKRRQLEEEHRRSSDKEWNKNHCGR